MALTDNLVSYWKLDETSGTRVDSHSSNDLTDNNTVGSATGILGNAADFESDNSEFLNCTDSAELSFGDEALTIAFWFKSESTGDTKEIIHKGSGSSYEYLVQLNFNQRPMFNVFGSSGFGDSTTIRADNFGDISLDTWYFVVVWHDPVANEIGISVNDSTPETTSHTAGIYDGTGDFIIGKNSNNAGYFDGLVDEVGIWRRVLSSAERTELYNGGVGLTYPFTSGGKPFLNYTQQMAAF